MVGTGFPGVNTPANDWPQQHELRTREVRYQFSGPLPDDAILWVLDTDGSETLVARFYDCSATPALINPSAFDSYFLSTAAAHLPVLTFSATSVQVTAPTPSQDRPNATVGIVIRSDSVCRVEVDSTVGDGSQDVFFSIPAPLVTVNKGLGTNRIADGDQFTTRILTGGEVANSTAASTTAGSGSTVTAGTGTTGPTPVRQGEAHVTSEAPAGSTQLDNYVQEIACANANAGSPTVLPSGSGQDFTITPLHPLDDITCTLTNHAKPKVTITKVSNGQVGTFSFSGDNGIVAHDITTVTPGAGVDGPMQVLDAPGVPTTLSEEGPLPGNSKLVSVSCTGLGPGGSADPAIHGPGGGSVPLDAAATALGSDIQCVFTNGPLEADLYVTKDNGLEGVMSGDTVTYTIVVGNNGRDAVSGAVVRDPASSRAGLDCTGPVTCTSTPDGICPAAGVPLAVLESGLVLGELPEDGTVTLSLACTVQ